MRYHQPHILKNRGTEELQMFIMNKLIDEDILDVKLKENFLVILQMMECLKQQIFLLHYCR